MINAIKNPHKNDVQIDPHVHQLNVDKPLQKELRMNYLHKNRISIT